MVAVLMAPESIVTPLHVAVSCLPEGHDERWQFKIRVEYCGGGLYYVTNRTKYLSAAGRWDLCYDPDEAGEEWLDAHRFDFDTALRLARESAPTLTYHGRTVAQALADTNSAVAR